MNLFSSFSRALLCLGALLLPTLHASAQSTQPAPSSTPNASAVLPIAPAVTAEAVKAATAELDAIPLSPTQVIPRADEIPDGGEPAPISDSALWRLESAQQLLRWGVWFKQQGDAANAGRAAQKAQQQIAAAEKISNDDAQPALGARRHELAGLICEQVLNDKAGAQSHYDAALKLAPNSALARSRMKNLVPKTAPTGG